MSGFLGRLGMVVHWIGLIFIFFCLFFPFIYMAGNFDRQTSEEALFCFFGAIIWWPIRWVLTGRTSIRPIAPQEFTND
jgi:hypothetical protein